ncbi:lipid A deacylase LpxR family protein [Undibacterium sp. Ren11W]|uniref:lipid A deacylase LpxR family protein n=1 Tax=Undibacterium sp. Ren11W TaxID=3413045 RepID=UPI003BF1DEC9
MHLPAKMQIKLIGKRQCASTILIISLFALCNQSLAVDVLPSVDEWSRVSASGSTVYKLAIDNDSLLLKKDDGFYTSGSQISISKVLNSDNRSLTYGWKIAQDLYTASDIKLYPNQLSPIDHPYAGWLYTGIFKELSESNGQGWGLGLDLGCFGPCAGGRRTQTQLHKLLDQPLPQGWDTQLRQEWGVVLSGEWRPARWSINQHIDVSPGIKARFGNIFTDASVGAILRLGSLNALPEQPGNYGFLRGEIIAIGYDATLQGGYFNNQQLAVNPKSAVTELELGYQWRGATYGLYASIIRRSNGIKELDNSTGAQNFARLQFIYGM